MRNIAKMNKKSGPIILSVLMILAILIALSLGIGHNATQDVALAEESGYNADVSLINEEGGYIDYNAAVSSYVETAPILAAADGKRYVYNLVIYICFSDESDAFVALQNNPSYAMLSGEDKSLHDYYDEVSYGKVQINTLYPYKDGTLVAVYKAPGTRSSYQVKDGDAGRALKEKSLLMGALEEVSSYFDLNGIDVDANDDGKVDAVSFLISGSSSSSWGSLLWPHSWDLDSIGGSFSIGGASVSEYSFNFVNSLTLGVTCHEFFHVLGAPDLYHYEYDFTPVGKWDLMQSDLSMPQYSLVYMRQKYLQAIDDDQIGTIAHNGVYSLKPVTITAEDEIVAYKIPTGKSSEYIMVEYRNPGLSDGYDSLLPGAGLIIYRIKEGENGNRDGIYKSTSSPDEVYVYRPQISFKPSDTKTQRLNNSASDLNYANLSPNNSYFSRVGATLAEKPTKKTSERYDYSTLYYVDGTNTGIIIEAVSISNSSIEFRVKLNGGTSVNDSYFSDKIALGEVAFVNSNEFSGVSATINTSNNLDVSYVGSMTVSLLDGEDAIVAQNTLSAGKFQSNYLAGTRVFSCRFVVSDKGSVLSSVFNNGEIDLQKTPTKVHFSIVDSDGDVIDLGSKAIDDSSVTWSTVLATQSDLTAGVVCGDRATFGIRNDGTVVSGVQTAGSQWDTSAQSNVIAVAAGLTHTLFLNKDLTVSVAYGKKYYGETAVTDWSDIVMIAAGHYTSYGLTASGRVYAVGRNNVNQLSVSNWMNIIYIAAGENFVIGLSKAGVLYSAGDNTSGQRNLSGVSNVKTIACGNTFAAYLTKDGRVIVKGSLIGQGEVGKWSDIVKIAAGKNVLLGLKADGTVIAAGDNSYGQLDVDGLLDIEDLDAGEYHTAFLRADGVVEFRGIGSADYKTNEPLPNLKYDDYTPVTSIAVSADRTSAFIGETITLGVGILPLYPTYVKLVYTSSDESIATVSQRGLVTCVGIGTATIYVSDYGSGVVGTITIRSQKYVELMGIGFASESFTLTEGNSIELLLEYSPSDATISGWVITYSSNVPERARVTAGGILEGISYCDTTITVTATNISTGKVLTGTCKVVVVTTLTGMNWSNRGDLSNTYYYYGESLNVQGLTFTVNSASGGQSDPMNVTEEMVSGFNSRPNFGGKSYVVQTLTVTYMDKSITFDVKVYDYTIAARFISTPKNKFIYGESFGVGDGGVLELTTAGGKVTTRGIESGEADTSEYMMNQPGMYPIYVSITTKRGGSLTIIYNVQVQDTVLSVTSTLIQTTYYFGEEIDPNEQLSLTMRSGAIRTATFGDATIEGFDNKVIGGHNIKIIYVDPVTNEAKEAWESITIRSQFEIDFGDYVMDDTDITGSGSSSARSYIYYYIGEELPITVNATAGSNTFALTQDEKSEDNIYFEVDGFDKFRYAASDDYGVLVRVFAKSTSGWQEVYLRRINTYGVKKAKSTRLCGVGTDYNYGDAISGAYLEIDYMDNTTGTWSFDDISCNAKDPYIYDSELVDEAQTLQFKYLNGILSVTKTIIIHDVMLEILPLENQTVTYGEDVTFTISIDMKKGENKVVSLKTATTDGFTLSAYNTSDASLIGVIQPVTVSYGGLSASFNLVVEDVLLDIVVLNDVQSTYKYGCSFSAFSLYELRFKSGITKPIYYNDTDFSCLPEPNMSKLGEQSLVIYYKPLKKEFLIRIEVVNYVVSLVANSGYKNSYRYGEALDLSLTATYADGSQKTVLASECTSNYDSVNPSTQYVYIAYKDRETAYTYITVSVSDGIKSVTWLSAPGYTNFKYGEALSFPGATIRVDYEKGSDVDYRGMDIVRSGAFEISYNPTKVGSQTVTISKEGKSVSFSITVEAASSKTLVFTPLEDVIKSKDEKSIIATNGKTMSEVANMFATIDYLTVTIIDQSGAQIAIEDDAVMKTGYSVCIVNSNGDKVYTYKYVLRGDADSDGYLTQNDLGGLAELYLSGSYDKSLTDSNNDGTFSLTDIVDVARRATDANKSVNAMARGFITDVKYRKQEEGASNENA